MSTLEVPPPEQTNGAQDANEQLTPQKPVSQENDSGSDTGEKPVRQRLEKTTIARSQASTSGEVETFPDSSMDIAEDTNKNDSIQAKPVLSANDVRGRPTRKRSLEDLPSSDNKDALDGPPTPSSAGHARKRSRDVQLGDPIRSNGLGRSPEPTLREEDELEIEVGAGGDEKEQTKGQDKHRVEEQPAESIEMSTSSSDSDRTKTDIEPMQSPRRKRSRDDFESEIDRDQKIAATDETRARRSSEEERPETPEIDVKVTGQESDQNELDAATESSGAGTHNVPTKSSTGFSNTSAVSPFSSLTSTKSALKDPSTEVPQTSSSAFAASGFASMAGSASPFGTLGTKNPSPSKSPPPTSPPSGKSLFGALVDAQKAIPFGGNTTSSFAPASTAAGKVFGSGFGGGFGGGQKLSSFAAPVGDTKLGGNAKEKPFGAAEESEDNDSGSDGGSEGGAEAADPEAEQSNQFQIQEIDTGEEGEDTLFTTRAKLFQYHPEKKAWAERGIGPFKLNVKRKDNEEIKTPAWKEEETDVEKEEQEEGENETAKNDEDETRVQPPSPKVEGRFIMRTTATHKVILNTPIFKELSMSDQKGQEPKGKQILFSVPVDGKLIPYLLRLGKDEDIKKLYRATRELQEKM